jgi:hypothetical protein
MDTGLFTQESRTPDPEAVCAILTGEDGSYSGNDEGEDDSRAGIVTRHHAGH